MNPELAALFDADHRDRDPHPAFGTPAYLDLRRRDAARRARVLELASTFIAPEDFFRAAWIMQHGDDVDDVARAREFALKAAGLGVRPARWLAAAALDRWLMYQGKPQRYGTNIVPDGVRQRLWDVDPATTDADRAAWDVPPLAEMVKRARKVTEEESMPPMEQAPAWLKEAVERWRKEVWVVKRRDDNGNEFEVARLATREEAAVYAEEMSAKGHKQDYLSEREVST